MFRRTKIVATLGPACSDSERLAELVEAGVNVFRLNFSHGDESEREELIQAVRRVSAASGASVALLGDLQGPKIRIGAFREGAIELENGAAFRLDTERGVRDGDRHGVHVSYPRLPGDCGAGDILLLDDGLIELEVEAVGDTTVDCRVISGGRLSDFKGVNRRGGGLSAPALTEKDRRDIVRAAELDLDYLALSFPRNAADVEEARQLYREAGGTGGMVAKIERAEAVADEETLDGILDAADGVMVARGDLAVEIGDAELVGVQKHIIRRARELDRFVITATQMMESMTHHRQPTRAEVSDVANAVLDGTDAVMLSAETAVGRYPVNTVQAMDRIIRGAERAFQSRVARERPRAMFRQVDESVAVAAMFLANHLEGVRAIIAMTESGSTPRLMSRERSGIPVFAFTPHARTRRRVAIYRGVQPEAFDSEQLPNEAVNREAVRLLEDKGVVQPGDRVVITKGDYVRAHGGTNALKVVQVGEPIH